MGKRGPEPKGEFDGKSAVLSTRIRPDTKAALAEAAKASGRSLSQEIEFRLRRSFAEDEKIDLGFGDEQTFAVLRTAAMAVKTSRFTTEVASGGHWLSDAWAFERVVATVFRVLWAFRPAGDAVPPATFKARQFGASSDGNQLSDLGEGESDAWAYAVTNIDNWLPEQLLEAIAKSDPAALPGDRSAGAWQGTDALRLSYIRCRLGPVADRLKKDDDHG
jgi:hypothetical protein